jgi:hypothetical protein
MFQPHRAFIAAAAAIVALLASGCASAPGHGQGPHVAMMAENERCMMMMHGDKDGKPGMPMAGKPMSGKSMSGKPMDCNCQCPMMQQQKAAADAPPVPAAEHNHAPDAPPPASH